MRNVAINAKLDEAIRYYRQLEKAVSSVSWLERYVHNLSHRVQPLGLPSCVSCHLRTLCRKGLRACVCVRAFPWIVKLSFNTILERVYYDVARRKPIWSEDKTFTLPIHAHRLEHLLKHKEWSDSSSQVTLYSIRQGSHFDCTRASQVHSKNQH